MNSFDVFVIMGFTVCNRIKGSLNYIWLIYVTLPYSLVFKSMLYSLEKTNTALVVERALVTYKFRYFAVKIKKWKKILLKNVMSSTNRKK